VLCLGCAVGGALAYPALRPGRRGLGGLDVDGGGDCGHGHDAEGGLRATRGAEKGSSLLLTPSHRRVSQARALAAGRVQRAGSAVASLGRGRCAAGRGRGAGAGGRARPAEACVAS